MLGSFHSLTSIPTPNIRQVVQNVVVDVWKRMMIGDLEEEESMEEAS